MKINITGRLYIGFALAFVISALIGTISYQAFQKQINESGWVDHTYKVMNQTQLIQKLILDMETGRRGYRSTGDKKFLEPYYNSISEVDPAFRDLTNLVQDNPDELRRVHQFQDNIGKLMQFWRDHQNDASKYTREQITNITDQEKTLMDAIRVSVNAILDAENILLTRRERANNQSSQISSTVSVVGIILVQIIILILIYSVINEFRIRKKAEGALQDNLNELEMLNRESNEKNWLLTGMSNVNISLQGINDVSSLVLLILKSIVSYLEVPAGAIYIFNEEENGLVMRASIGLPENVSAHYRPGEGIVGAAAQAESIHVVKNIPANYWMLHSASGHAQPGEVLCIPLWFNKELKGVIELGTFGTFKHLQIDLLKNVSNSLAVAINAAEAREKIIQLLEQVQKQKENLQLQEEELRQSNEELTQQAEILQASEEELKVQEEELRQINAELEEKNEAVEIARQSLSQKAKELEITSKYKSEFLANMSHELRTPLNSVLILAKLLAENKNENLSAKQVEYANIIHKSGYDLLNLINDILDLSKIEAGKIDLNFEHAAVNDIAEDMRQLFYVVAEEKSIKFSINIEDHLPEKILTDRLRFEQVIKNLLSNAFKFTGKGGEVSLSLKSTTPPTLLSNDMLRNAEKVLAVVVNDTGIGITRDKQKIIFEAFQQADGSTNRRFGGTGLGLSISKELVKKLGGEILLESEEGKGSTFTVYFPFDSRIQNQAQSIVTDENDLSPLWITDKNFIEQTKLQDDKHNLNKGDRIMLIIEDDIHFAQILRDFARDNNYKAIIALQGDEGFYYARKYKPSAIILDIQLPVIDGRTLLKALKADDRLKNIPVHVISAGEESMNSAPGAIAYLKKPVEKENLENVFSLIKNYIKGTIKKVLILSGNYLNDNSLKQIIGERHLDVEYDYSASEKDALKKLENKKYDCLIADIGKDLKKGITQLQYLKHLIEEREVPVIIYMDKDLSAADELELKKVTDIIIHDSSHAKDRLMDELELFLYKVQDTKNAFLPRSQSNISDDKILHGKKVLLADDDVRNVFALNTLLEDYNMDVLTASDGREAIDLMNDHPDVDIVLMDIMMPEMDGYEAIQKIRANPNFISLPIIALTAKAMQGDREKVIQAGASDYISKPIDNSRLMSLIRVWLSQ